MSLSVKRYLGIWAAVALGCVVTAVSSCNSVTVTSVGVTRVDVSPGTAELVTGQVLQLSASAFDGDGKALTSAAIVWSAEPSELVQVDASGRVIALAPGSAIVSATSDGVTGTATLSIGPRGVLALDAAQLILQATAGAIGLVERTIGIDAADNGRVMELSTQVAYDGEPTGWLAASLSSDRAPAQLAVVASPTSLAPGEYRATVNVLSGTAKNSPMSIDVRLSVTAPPPIIVLSSRSVALAGVDTRLVDVTNGGPGDLTDLLADIEYAPGGPTGWLSVGLSDTRAPSTLAIGSDDSALPPGSYAARVVVRSADPAVVPQAVDVTLDGGQQAPKLALGAGAAQLTASVGSSSTVNVSVFNGGSGSLTGLRATAGYAPGQPRGWLATSLSSNTTPSVLRLIASAGGLAPGTYNASVEVVGNAPNSPVLLPVTFTVTAGLPALPTAPSGMTTALTPTPGVSVTWNDNSTNETSFALRRSVSGGSVQVTAYPANTTTVLDNSVSPGTSYVYEVQACNAAGCSTWAGPVTVLIPTPGSVPAAPSGLVAQATGPWSVALGWTDNSTNETGFDVRKRGASGHWQIWKTTPANVTSELDRGVGPGGTYDYQVRACNAQGCSAWTAVVSVTTPVPYQ